MIHYETINEAGRQLAAKIQQELPAYQGEAIVFIGSLGICVRKIQSLIQDKYTDPAVVCIDSTGRWVIPVLSGHVGGANELARTLARITGGEPVITTQSDNLGLWALDLLAQTYRWNCSVMQRTEMNALIARFVNGEPTALILEWEDEGTRMMRKTCPSHVTIYDALTAYVQAGRAFAVTIAVSYHLLNGIMLQYYPRCLHLGIGCQKQTPAEAAKDLLQDLCQKGFAPAAIDTIGTIDLKKDEPLLERLCTLLPTATCSIYEAAVLATVPVPHPSRKVREVTGCNGVAEAAALMQGPLLVEKTKGCHQGTYYTYALSVRPPHGRIEIVGAGPGDPDLISVRGRQLLEQADLILYAGSLVPRELTHCAKADATIRSSADMELEEQFQLMKSFYDRGLLVVRLHTGDPCIYGAIQEQMAFFDCHKMDYRITPGISSFLAAAAELRSQLTIPERVQTIILTRAGGRTPVADKEQLHQLAVHQSTMCIFLSASMAQQVQDELLAGGYPPETPVAACHKLTWKDQRIYRGQLRDLASIMQEHHLTLTTMIVVGDAIDNRQGKSKLYDGHFTHLFRKGKDDSDKESAPSPSTHQ